MKKRTFQLITILLFITGCKKDEEIECNIYDPSVHLYTQKDVDNFDCEFVQNLYISTENTREKITITDKHFKNLKTIENQVRILEGIGEIEILDNAFNSLEEASQIFIDLMNQKELSAFNSIQHLPLGLTINGVKFTTIEGFDSLLTIGDKENGDLELVFVLQTPELKNIIGFKNLLEIGYSLFTTPSLTCNKICFFYDKVLEGKSLGLLHDDNGICKDTAELEKICAED